MEEWEELLHLGSLRRTYPTLSHNATLFAHSLPHPHPSTLPRAKNPGATGLGATSEARHAPPAPVQGALQQRVLRRALQAGPCARDAAGHTIAAP